MSWARVDDAWWCHPKVLGLDLDARGLWVSALSWSCQQKTDRIPEQIVRMCGDDGTAAAKLVDAGLWDEDEQGWSVHDWHDYQSEAAKKAEAGRKGGRASGDSRRAKANTKQDDEADEGASREAEPAASDEAGPSRPVPTQPQEQEPSSAVADPEVSQEVRDLTRRFAIAVKANGFKVPAEGQKNRTAWLTDMDRLLRLGAPGGEPDPQKPDEVARVIDFATSDSFWRANIGSPSKFREQYPKLRLRCATERPASDGRRGGVSLVD